MSSPEEDVDPFNLTGVTISEKYRVGRVVGSGGFGVVYRGVHTGFGEPIAVKCLKLPAELDAAGKDKLLARLQDEGRVLHRLSKLSSSIVQALDVGAVTSPRGDWVPYLVLEWLDGQTLREHLNERAERGRDPYSLREAVTLLDPVARALAIAHRQKVAHRDVKPDNIFMANAGGQRSLKVLDFGIAKVLAQEGTFTAAPAATQRGATAFTPSYAAPEQFNKKRGATGPWTDVFALALILVELVRGERALEGDDATQLYIAAADPQGRPTLRYHGVDTSDDVEDVLQQALAIEPNDRFQDAGAFWEALQTALPVSKGAAKADVSETGAFIEKHDIALDGDLSDPVLPPTRREADAAVVTDGDIKTTLRRDLSAHEDDANEAQEDDESEREISAVAAAPAKRAQAPSDPPDAGEARASKPADVRAPRKSSQPPPKPRSLKPKPKRDETLDTITSSPPTSSRWLPVVVGIAIGAAAMLYWQLRSIDGDGDDNPNRPRLTSDGPNEPAPTAPVVPASIPRLDVDAGAADADVDAADADLDADVDAEDADVDAGPPEPPEGMALVGSDPGFFIDELEVSVSDYAGCVSASRCEPATHVSLTPEAFEVLGVLDADRAAFESAWQGRCNARAGNGDMPVNCVTFRNAQAYCTSKGKRLPTGTEWLAAAGDGRYIWGDAAPTCADSCYGANTECSSERGDIQTCVRGSHKRDITGAGVADLAGNVAEWVVDSGPKLDPTGPPSRIVRGGSFYDGAKSLPSKTARAFPPTTSFVGIGFRCALDVTSD